MNLQMNNPNQPGPGEMVNENIPGSFRVSRRGSASASPIAGLGDPHHQRNPSLGEIHQVMEQEEEAHVVCPGIHVRVLLRILTIARIACCSKFGHSRSSSNS